MAWDIQKVQKGKRPTLLEADKANELINAINALGNITIRRNENGSNEVSYLNGAIILGIGSGPPGFFEKEIEICESGVVKKYKMLVKGPID